MSLASDRDKTPGRERSAVALTTSAPARGSQQNPGQVITDNPSTAGDRESVLS